MLSISESLLEQLITELDEREVFIRNTDETTIQQVLTRKIKKPIKPINCYENELASDLEKCKNVKKFTFNGEIHLAKVVRCYDGDTCYCIFKHNNELQLFSLRMYGYDSWEMRIGRDVPTEERKILKEKALIAKHRLEELVMNDNVYVFCQEFDKYGRILATIKLDINDDISVNEIMVNEGHGYNYFGGTKKENRL
jgi:endonuclease YncB( thermonuclease family)